MHIDQRSIVVASDNVRQHGTDIWSGRKLAARITPGSVAGFHGSSETIDVEPELARTGTRRCFEVDIHGRILLRAGVALSLRMAIGQVHPAGEARKHP